jgi:hypothetical protein
VTKCEHGIPYEHPTEYCKICLDVAMGRDPRPKSEVILSNLVNALSERNKWLEVIAKGVHSYFYEPCNDGEAASMHEARIKLALRRAGYTCPDLDDLEKGIP